MAVVQRHLEMPSFYPRFPSVRVLPKGVLVVVALAVVEDRSFGRQYVLEEEERPDHSRELSTAVVEERG